MPGDDWISNFVKRNRLSKRTASNIIKRSRSAINAEVINKYFDELDVAFERLGMLLSFFCNEFVEECYMGYKLQRFY